MEEPFDMENHLKEVIDRMGGAFKATSLLQKRLKSLNQGAQKLVDVTSRNQFDIAFAELLEEKIALGNMDLQTEKKKKKTKTTKTKKKSTTTKTKKKKKE